MQSSTTRPWASVRWLAHVVSLLPFALMTLTVPGRPIVAQGQDEDAQVLLVHAWSGAEEVSVLLDGELAFDGLAFGTATDPTSLAGGSHEVAFVVGDDVIVSAGLPLSGGRTYEIVVTGKQEETDLRVYRVDFGRVGDERARIRVVNVSPDVGAVDLAVAGGTVLCGGVEFPAACVAAGAVAADTYDLEVRTAGTEDIVLELPEVGLEAGTVTDVFIVGSAADDSLRAVPLTVARVPDIAEDVETGDG